jgi:hypothetical protein
MISRNQFPLQSSVPFLCWPLLQPQNTVLECQNKKRLASLIWLISFSFRIAVAGEDRKARASSLPMKPCLRCSTCRLWTLSGSGPVVFKTEGGCSTSSLSSSPTESVNTYVKRPTPLTGSSYIRVYTKFSPMLFTISTKDYAF